MNVWDTFCIGNTMDQVHGPGPEKESNNYWTPGPCFVLTPPHVAILLMVVSCCETRDRLVIQ